MRVKLVRRGFRYLVPCPWAGELMIYVCMRCMYFERLDWGQKVVTCTRTPRLVE